MELVPTPKQLATQAILALKAAGDDRTATQARSYFKPGEKIVLYGVSTPGVRRIERDLFQTVRPDWSVDDALQSCHILIQHAYMEAKFVGLLLLSRYNKRFDTGLLRPVKSWLSKNYCNNWAATDSISTLVLAPLIRQFPPLLPAMRDWTVSKNLWLRRAAAVALTPAARKGEHLEDAYAIARLLFDDREDLIHKATGWLLREAGKTNPARLEAFLLAHGPNIPRTTLRYAIERFPPATRLTILHRTKNTANGE